MENKKQENLNFNNVSEIEILSKRGKREKHFLQKDGTIIARMYSDNIHFKENDKYIEIDNRLEKIQNYYKNKRNSFNVYFKENSCDNFLGYELNDGYLSFELLNNNNVPVKILDNGNQFSQTVKYENLFDGIDFEYVVTPTTLKENIVIKNKNDILDVINFRLNTNLKLELNNGSINAIKDNEVLFNLDVPYMIDSNKFLNHNVKYELREKQGFYELDLILDQNWLNSDSIVYPVTIDPTISTYNDGNVYDTMISTDSKDFNYNEFEFLESGVRRLDGLDIIKRTLLKFDLPKIGTSSQIVQANLHLANWYALNFSIDYQMVDVHRIIKDWDETTATWNNMHNQYDSRIEATASCIRSFLDENQYLNVNDSYWDITQLVKQWYSGVPNYGVLLKSHNEVYVTDLYPVFFSSQASLGENRLKPSLEIRYKNNNGLESYMNYQSQAVTNGVIYENIFNGNMIGTFSLCETIGGKLPIKIGLVYNTNDVILANNIGFGLGFKLNLQQTIKKVKISQVEYLEYFDSDGTIHYFLKDGDIYRDEDDLNMTITEIEESYLLNQSNGNKMKFIKKEDIGYLTEYSDNLNNKVNIFYTTSNLIDRVISGNSKVEFIYSDDKIIIINQNEIVTLNYLNGMLVNINYKDGLIKFEYNNKIISKIVDVSGMKFSYQYYGQIPYRVKKVTEFGKDGNEGKSFEFMYGNKLTTIVDNKGRAVTYNFNEDGLVLTTSVFQEDNNIEDAYASVVKYDNNRYSKNKLLSRTLPIKHIKNYLSNASFETDEIYFTASNGILLSISDDCSLDGTKSLKVENNSNSGNIKQEIKVQKGKFYTLSAYLKSSVSLKLLLSYINSDNVVVEKFIDIPADESAFIRYDVSIDYPADAKSDLKISFCLLEMGVLYIDNIQLETGEVANIFNYVDNSDFSDGLDNWNPQGGKPGRNNFEIVKIDNSDKNILKICMDIDYDTSITKQININGEEGDQITISFWYKNNGIITNTYNTATVIFNYIDDVPAYDISPISLNPSYDRWQLFCLTYTALGKYNSINLNLFQMADANELYIADVSLFKNVSSINYSYDMNGNITLVSDFSKGNNKFNYNKENQLSEIIDPTGKKTKFEYDNIVTDRVINIISTNNISSEIGYDENGNSTILKIKKVKYSGNLSDGIYNIRISGTNNYISKNEKFILSSGGICGNQWFVEKKDDYYIIKYALLYDIYFNEYNGLLKLGRNLDHKSRFDLIENDNGSYYIKLHSDEKYLKFDSNCFRFTSLDENDVSFKFYFENNNKKDFIENNVIYNKNNFVNVAIDANLNKTVYDVDSNTGLLNSIKKANNQIISYEYNLSNNINSINNGNRNVRYFYNNNLLEKVIQGKKMYSFCYDEFENIKEVKTGENNVLITNNYESNNGNLISIIHGNNQKIFYDYDYFDRINKITKMDDIYHYKYDNNGNLAKLISNNCVQKYLYDYSKRLIQYCNNDFFIKYDYDINDNVINKKYRLNDTINNVKNYFDDNDFIVKEDVDDNIIDYEYDNLGRLIKVIVNQKEALSSNYNYLCNGDRSSTLVCSVGNNNNLYSYKYNKMNQITHIYHNNNLENRYYYNKNNELIKEDNFIIKQTIVYRYDDLGNLVTKTFYKLGTYEYLNQNKYSYDDINWADKLTSFNGEKITYDEIGNPLTIGKNISLEWINGRELSEYSNSNDIVKFYYNQNGIRTQKEVNGVKTRYYLEGSSIVYEERENELLYYIRDAFGDLVGFKHNENVYYYEKNHHDDIIGILDNNYNVVARYQYDSWGNILYIKDGEGNDVSNNKSHIANINPFRYRSYYYDKETQWYYLVSRYYNPRWGRFISSDNKFVQNDSLTGNNMYVYSENDPINNVDLDGHWSLKKFIQKSVKKVTKVVNKIAQTITKVVKKVKAVVNNTIKSIKSICSTVKNAFVFEAGVGIGYGKKVGVGEFSVQTEIYDDWTFKIENGEVSTGSSISAGISIRGINDINEEGRNFGLSADLYHPSHFANDGSIKEGIIHSQLFPLITDIWNCPETSKEFLVGTKVTKNSGATKSDNQYFVGLDLSSHDVFGGHIKIGFNISY